MEHQQLCNLGLMCIEWFKHYRKHHAQLGQLYLSLPIHEDKITGVSEYAPDSYDFDPSSELQNAEILRLAHAHLVASIHAHERLVEYFDLCLAGELTNVEHSHPKAGDEYFEIGLKFRDRINAKRDANILSDRFRKELTNEYNSVLHKQADEGYYRALQLRNELYQMCDALLK